MNARLGFSIAAHLEPDVLIIDEVLSVGDLAFQERAFGRMKEVVRSGIPVAVVSHQLDRVRSLCTHAILLKAGMVVERGTPPECIAAYVKSAASAADGAHRPVPGLSLDSLSILDHGAIRSGERHTMRLAGHRPANGGPVRRFDLSFQLRSLESGQVVYRTWSHAHGVAVETAGDFELLVDLQFNIAPGLYALETWAGDADREGMLGHGPVIQILVEKGPVFDGAAQMNPSFTLRQGRDREPPS